MFIGNNRKSTADRFIPRRAGENFEISHFQLKAEIVSTFTTTNITHDGQKYVNYAHRHYKQNLYRQRLWETVIAAPRKILNFSDPHTVKPAKPNMRTPVEQQWPVKPRKKPMIGSPIVILDMPNLEPNLCTHITDWGKTGYIASIFEKNVFLLNPTTNNDILNCRINRVEHCVRWNRTGTRFAYTSTKGGIEVWDMQKQKIIYKTKCRCGNCVVTCLEWATESKYLISGCTNGSLCIWTSSLKLVKEFVGIHSAPIINIAFSCLDNYFASTGVDEYVKLWKWPAQPHFQISLSTATRCIAWHPWKDSLLVTGGKQASMILWNVNNMIDTDSRMGPDPASHFDAMTFNRSTGELLASYWTQNKDDTSNLSGQNAICVFSNFETIVDCLEWHVGRVPYLMWGADDNLLGTAGSDENLCIWEFLDRDKYGKKKKTSSYDRTFGQCIR